MSKCWYCNEELTTANYCDEHIGICTKCYASMFKVSNDFVKGLTDKIADLEAKLAESEEKLKAMETLREMVNEDSKLNYRRYIDTLAKNEQLEQQLAEKEEQLNNSEQKCLICHKDQENEQLKKQLAEKEKDLIIKCRTIEVLVKKNEKNNQDKISFCIEKLVDVRSFVSDATEIKEPDYTKVCNYIENQIKELKKGMK